MDICVQVQTKKYVDLHIVLRFLFDITNVLENETLKCDMMNINIFLLAYSCTKF